MSEASLKIGEVARRTGLSVRTLRHYDEFGLLVPSERTYGEHRLYSSEDFRRLLAVQHLKELGLSSYTCRMQPIPTLARRDTSLEDR